MNESNYNDIYIIFIVSNVFIQIFRSIKCVSAIVFFYFYFYTFKTSHSINFINTLKYLPFNFNYRFNEVKATLTC